jgi:hypothetical protein
MMLGIPSLFLTEDYTDSQRRRNKENEFHIDGTQKFVNSYPSAFISKNKRVSDCS